MGKMYLQCHCFSVKVKAENTTHPLSASFFPEFCVGKKGPLSLIIMAVVHQTRWPIDCSHV